MGNQADMPGVNVAPIVAEAPAQQNGAANVDPHNSAVVVDGAVAVAAAAVEKTPPPRIDKDLSSHDLFLNRELTWLAFNRRVLHEAEDERNPLLERLKFLAITASNLDEFFMKRIGGLKQQVVAGMQELTVDGRTPQQQIAECYSVVREQEQRQRELGPQILAQLEQYGIRLRPYNSLTADERKTIREYYYKNIFPLVTPQAMDPAHPFPFVSNLSLNLLVTARYQNDSDPMMARVKVPIGFGIPRFLRISNQTANQNDFVRLEDVVANNLDLLFPSMIIDSYELFRVTRNANTERDEDEADDLLALIESELRDRRFAPIVRLEVLTGMNPVHRGMVAAELGLDERSDVFEVDGMLSMRDLQELASIDAPALHDPPHHPVDHPRLTVGRSIFHVIRDAGSILLLHPYESFSTSVERFLREAADDPKVRAIKMTLYRTSSDSKIIGYLCDAARNGKQVAVVVELKARFDEAANIQFATRLEEFGIHVTYGVVGLKTHCKVILVIRQDYNGLRRYAHIGTGNYHPGTARFYADYGLLTCDDTIGEDLTQLFNYLTTGYMPDRSYRKILPAPTHLKRELLNRIEREIKISSAASPGLIQFKVNALEDVDITRALYRASQAGVKVDLIVRDTCRLRPGIAGLSENVRVVSIVGRFLEHGRLYYFRNGGAEDFLLGSADCMKRNLESRVEVVAPVEDPLLRKELRIVLDIQLKPNRCQWEMQSDGVYIRTPAADAAPACQQALIDFADTRQTEASKVKRRRSKGFARRAAREERNGD
ncbi:MAG TPA: polyphosphate kinase 1 [Candidatus Dormibacteraeota bacterium]|nr:polyphosphate kinase 1 [Candidatus Dormibacteraeota bacterium]